MSKLLISFICGFTFAYFYESGGKHLAKWLFHDDNTGLIVFGYRLHHSLYGLLALIIAAMSQKLFWGGFGLGIIAQHTVFGGFQFISREG